MTDTGKYILSFTGIALLILCVGLIQGWNTALVILNMGLISAIMALGVNLQWGIAGLLNIGIMGFVALGGLAAVVVSMPQQADAWTAGGPRVVSALAVGAATIAMAVLAYVKMAKGRLRTAVFLAIIIVGYFIFRLIFDPAVAQIEAVNPAVSGYLGGLGLPILLSWPAGALLAAAAAWLIGKTALGLRSDYLAIATLGISEIIIAILKNEDWLSRGVKNVVGLPRPVPYEIDLQQSADFVANAEGLGLDPVFASTVFVKLCYAGLFATCLAILLILAELALRSPWGRMMRAIRDNEVSAAAMGKNVKARHLQVFILGSAICGMAGAMMVTLDGQLTPSGYQPLRFTFLIWVMVIVGGSGNNFGAILGGFVVWFLWVQVEPMGNWLVATLTAPLPDTNVLKIHLLDTSAYMRPLTLGLVLLIVLRFRPRGLLPGR